MLCIIWFLNLHSYKQLNSGKFRVILDLERKLSYAFYEKEWNFLEEGKKVKTYFKLTAVEKFVPFFMMVPYILLLVFV